MCKLFDNKLINHEDIYIKYEGKHSVSVHYVNEGDVNTVYVGDDIYEAASYINPEYGEVIVDENMPEDMLEVLFTEWYKMAS